MSTNNINELSPLLNNNTKGSRFTPRTIFNGAVAGLGGGSAIYHGYCVGTDCDSPAEGWTGLGLSIALFAVGGFNLLWSQFRDGSNSNTVNPERVTIISSNEVKTEDPEELQKIAELVDNLVVKVNLGSRKSNNTKISEKIKENLIIIDQLITESETNKKNSSLSEEHNDFEKKILELQEKLDEANTELSGKEFLINTYAEQIERLQEILESSDPNEKQEAHNIINNLKVSAQNSRMSPNSKLGTPKKPLSATPITLNFNEDKNEDK